MNTTTFLPHLRRLAIAALLAVIALGAIRSADASASGFERRLTPVNGSQMNIVDDESWPFSDEIESFPLDSQYFSGISLGPTRLSDFNETNRCAGDEVRVETQVKAELSTVYKDWIYVTLRGWLYEGDSCSSSDLDGVAKKSFWVGPDQTVSQDLRVRNDNEGGDYADIHFNLRNAKAPL